MAEAYGQYFGCLETLAWDSAKMVFPNSAEAAALMKRGYGKSWEVAGF